MKSRFILSGYCTIKNANQVWFEFDIGCILSSVCLISFIRKFLPFRESFWFRQKEPFSSFKRNFLGFLEGTFWFLQKETFRSFRRNFLVPLEGTFWFLYKEPFSPFRQNFLDFLDGSFWFLQKEPFRSSRRNRLDPLERTISAL